MGVARTGYFISGRDGTAAWWLESLFSAVVAVESLLPSPSPAWALAQALVRVLARTLPRAHGPLLEEEEEKERYPVLPEEVYFLLERRLLREDEDSLLPKDEDLLLRPDEEYLDLPPEEGYLLFPEA